MSQFNIRKILEKNQIVPVVTINYISEIDKLVENIVRQGITTIEVTLRTSVAFEAIGRLKRDYNDILDIGVGTIINLEQLKKVKALGVDFIVSPGLMEHLAVDLQKTKIPFIPGVVTPSEIMKGINLGYNTFKLFPAEIVGGVKLLKTYNSLFPKIKFCPTGGINEKNYKEYLELPNVICVGGSWVV
ncbi:MAG: 2-dehydro-3-deoxyphosphogluconate aldolase/(4S)-4-hydroxy-2-oxoglutarate aldolase [Planctomycetota bacterium]|jgi:2-dehydro-3-deoxyphosphogluconate aldolase/(4S)-4-hydroxy-2-oxoglutarate aldolase